MNDLREVLIHELMGAHSAETQLLKALPMMREAASSASLKRAFDEHLRETETQLKRLGEVAERLDVELEGAGCEGIAGLLEDAEEIIEDMDRGLILDAALIAAAQKVEHYEIAAYGTICALLKQLGEEQACDRLAQTLAEEKDTDERLTELAKQEINPAAAHGRPANDPAGRSTSAA